MGPVPAPTSDLGLCQILKYIRIPQDPRCLHLLFLHPSMSPNLI